MLTPEQVDTVSRSLIGHMATNTASRETIAGIATEASAELATAINLITQATPPVTADDVPAILAALRSIGAATPGFTSPPGISHVIFGKS